MSGESTRGGILAIFGALCLPGLLVASGCGKAKIPGRPELHAASGVVTFKQEPVEGATVVFIPQGHSNAAVGRTDGKGNFRMQTFDPGDGAAPGAYQVIVTKSEFEGEKERHLLPRQYSLPDKSGFTAEVKPDSDNTFQFDLKQ